MAIQPFTPDDVERDAKLHPVVIPDEVISAANELLSKARAEHGGRGYHSLTFTLKDLQALFHQKWKESHGGGSYTGETKHIYDIEDTFIDNGWVVRCNDPHDDGRYYFTFKPRNRGCIIDEADIQPTDSTLTKYDVFNKICSMHLKDYSGIVTTLLTDCRDIDGDSPLTAALHTDVNFHFVRVVVLMWGAHHIDVHAEINKAVFTVVGDVAHNLALLGTCVNNLHLPEGESGNKRIVSLIRAFLDAMLDYMVTTRKDEV